MPLSGLKKKEYNRGYHAREKRRLFLKVGEKYGRLTIISLGPKGRQASRYCVCRCDCGKVVQEVRRCKLKDGLIKSCGCLRAEIDNYNLVRKQKKVLQVAATRKEREQFASLRRGEVNLRRELIREKKKKQVADRVPWWAPLKRVQSFSVRHSVIKKVLDCEDIPNTDLLHSKNFYVALIWDGRCHYCDGGLPPAGHNLDRMSGEKHYCYNVVPCCALCNFLFRDLVTYEEKLILAPAIKEIRLRREANAG